MHCCPGVIFSIWSLECWLACLVPLVVELWCACWHWNHSSLKFGIRIDSQCYLVGAVSCCKRLFIQHAISALYFAKHKLICVVRVLSKSFPLIGCLRSAGLLADHWRALPAGSPRVLVSPSGPGFGCCFNLLSPIFCGRVLVAECASKPGLEEGWQLPATGAAAAAC